MTKKHTRSSSSFPFIKEMSLIYPKYPKCHYTPKTLVFFVSDNTKCCWAPACTAHGVDLGDVAVRIKMPKLISCDSSSLEGVF